MKNYFKKFSIMFVMSLMLSLGFCVSAFAIDDGVKGTNNLNNTAENSGKVGVALTSPEKGWKRYDDTNSNIIYGDGNWDVGTHPAYYKTTYHQIGGTSKYINFNFYGTKLRIIDVLNTVQSGRSDSVKITIDGTSYNYSEAGSIAYYILNFELTGLKEGIHNVKIQDLSSTLWFGLDAIDIDENGYLVNPNESITLDKSAINLNANDSQQLTATLTPAGLEVVWTSSDTSIATVDSTGKVTGLKEGTCTITAKTISGLTATCIVTVTKQVIPNNSGITTDNQYRIITNSYGILNMNNPSGFTQNNNNGGNGNSSNNSGNANNSGNSGNNYSNNNNSNSNNNYYYYNNYYISYNTKA